jgi:ubiquitin carboxyl-terminal hydrolase 4/11/15
LLLQVQFPLSELDLSRYVLHQQEQPPLYDCFAVSNHYGGMGGGHYTAFAQMPNDKKWFCFDDSRVEEIAPEGVSGGYIYCWLLADPVSLSPKERAS